MRVRAHEQLAVVAVAVDALPKDDVGRRECQQSLELGLSTWQHSVVAVSGENRGFHSTTRHRTALFPPDRAMVTVIESWPDPPAGSTKPT